MTGTPWTKADSRRFKELAIKEALGELPTIEELEELELLQEARRKLENPLSKEQIAMDNRRAEMLADLEKFFQKYSDIIIK